MIRAIGVAVVGASLAAAAPAFATSAETAATPSRPDPLSPLIFNHAVQPIRPNQALILARPASPDAFGTVAVNAGVTMYDARFRRVASTDARDPMVMRLAAGAANLDPIAKLRLVQQEISDSVHWSHDLDNMGVADFWANAGETLRRGTGDAEDIAIAKMQVLKAAGFDPRDLYISIGRHSSRGAHILLLARTASGFFALDDKDGMLPAAQDTKFTPIMTIGQGMSWVHGRRISGNPRLASAAARTRAK